MSRKTFRIHTLGCRINSYESEAVSEAFLEADYLPAKPGEHADVTLIHSCAVTADAEKKGRALISRALKQKKEFGGIVVLFGCMAQKRKDELYERYPQLDLVWGNARMDRIFSICDRLLVGKGGGERLPSLPRSYDTPAIEQWYSPRAFVKIQDGCNSFCTYCIVPYLRGRERNRPMGEILSEVEKLSRFGAREIVLSGIETAAFGAGELLRLAEKIACVDAIRRIRFGSLKPTLFTPDFCRGLAKNEKIMPQFHLSVQSASSKVLSAMRREYDREQLYCAVDALKSAIPHVALTADLIAGFPGEEESDHADTLSFIRDAALLHAHIFPYSEREGTIAAKMENQVPVDVRRGRAAELSCVSKEVRKGELSRILPLEQEILVERISGGIARGHSEHFVELSLPCIPTDAVGSMKKIQENKHD